MKYSFARFLEIYVFFIVLENSLMNFVVLKLLWFHDVVSHRWAHIIKISTLQRVRIFLAFLSSLSALPWSVSKALTDGFCFRTAGMLGLNNEISTLQSVRIRLSLRWSLSRRPCHLLTDCVFARWDNHENIDASGRTYLPCFSLVFLTLTKALV